MLKKTCLVLFLAIPALLFCGTADKTPKKWKIVSLAPSVTELLFAVGKGGSVIADTRQCDYPEKARDLPKIGDMANVNIEKIVSLKPDIVIASFSGNSREQVERLQSLGFRVLTLRADTVSDILSNTAELGKVFSIDVSFPMKVFRIKLDSVPKKPARKNTLLLLTIFPFFAVSTNSFMGDMLRIAGYQNAVRTAVSYPLLSREELLVLRPDTVILPERFRKDENELKGLFRELGLSPSLVYRNEDTMSRPGPRIFDTILELSRLR